MERSGSQAVLGSKPTTTYVQTDSTCFREIVQCLTGGSPKGKEKEMELTTSYSNKTTDPSSVSKGQTRLKLHERRQYATPTLQIPKPAGTGIQTQVDTALTLHSPSPTLYSSQKQISPSSWNSSSFMWSPLSKRGLVSSPYRMDEDVDNVKAMKERRLYLHSSPRSQKKQDEPELLTLFPLTSPKTM